MRRLIIAVVFAVIRCVAAGRESPIQLNANGTEMYREGRFQEAEALFRKALENWTPDLPGYARGRAAAMANLGEVLRATARYAEAEPLLLESSRVLDPGTTDLVHTLCSLAALYRARGNLTKAEEFARRAADSGTGKDRADALLCLASVYIEEHRYKEAEALIGDLSGSAQGTSAAVLYNNMAAAANAKGEFARGEELSRRALESAGRAVPERHALIATILNTMAQSCRFQAKYVEAETNYRRAIEIWEGALGPSHPDVARGLMNMASFYHERSREARAEEMYRKAAAIFGRSLGEDRVETLIAFNELAEVLRARRRYVEAEKLSRATLAALEKMLPPADPRLSRALFNHAYLLHDTQRQKEAEAILVRLPPYR